MTDRRPDTDRTPDDAAPGFDADLTELEALADELESGNVGVDALLDKARRAADLIDRCRTRLTATQEQVEAVLERIEPGPRAPAADEADGADGATSGEPAPQGEQLAREPDDPDEAPPF